MRNSPQNELARDEYMTLIIQGHHKTFCKLYVEEQVENEEDGSEEIQDIPAG